VSPAANRVDLVGFDLRYCSKIRSTTAVCSALPAIEVVVIPVSDVDRAAEFYGRLGWRLDADIAKGDSRVLQFTSIFKSQ